MDRHAIPLAERGWRVLGIDRDETTIEHATALNTSGLVLDIYNQEFFRTDRMGSWTSIIEGTSVETRQRMNGNRLVVELNYADRAEGDVFDWQLFTVDELQALGDQAGLELVLVSSDFDPEVAPDSGNPRMQLAFARH